MAVSVGYVDDLEAAIRHINMYGSGHQIRPDNQLR